MTRAFRLLVTILVAVALGACSNAGAVSPFASGAQDAAGGRTATSELVLRVRIPRRKTAHRSARYISAGTKSLAMSFTGPKSFKIAIDLTPADPRCSGSPLVCTITFDIAAGSYTVAAGAYNEAPVDGAIPAGAHELATAAGIRLKVKTGIGNTLSLTLDGVPFSILVESFAPADEGSGFLDKGFSVTVSDADGYTIVGKYETPVVLTDSDTTGVTAVTTGGSDNPPARTLLSSGDTAALSYSGQAIVPARITATSGSVDDSSVFEVYLPTYVADTSNNAVKEILIGCGDAGCVITVGGGFNTPYGVAVDGAGNAYVSDYGHNAVKKMLPDCYSTGCVETIGGGFNEPFGIAVDRSGNVFVADFGNNLVKKIPSGCISSTCVVPLGGGFDFAAGVAVDQSGTVFVADTFHNQVKAMSETCASASCVTVRNTGSAINTPTASHSTARTTSTLQSRSGIVFRRFRQAATPPRASSRSGAVSIRRMAWPPIGRATPSPPTRGTTRPS